MVIENVSAVRVSFIWIHVILFIQFMYSQRKEQFFEKLKFYPKFFILIVSEVCTIYPEAGTTGGH